MAKDPAFLFYYQDFAYGTRQMTFEEKGCYIELLCEQADVGHLTIDDIKRALGTSFCIWGRICNKFIQDDQGSFYNAKLEKTLQERRSYTKSRLDNLHMQTHMGLHMGNRNRDRNRDEDKAVLKDKKQVFRRPTLEQVIEYCKEIKSVVDPEIFFHYYESAGWIKANGQRVLNWKSTIRTWEKKQQKLPQQATTQGKPPAEIVALQQVAMNLTDEQIKDNMLAQGYTEQRIFEAITKARGKTLQ